jgi:hypothetical protein
VNEKEVKNLAGSLMVLKCTFLVLAFDELALSSHLPNISALDS